MKNIIGELRAKVEKARKDGHGSLVGVGIVVPAHQLERLLNHAEFEEWNGKATQPTKDPREGLRPVEVRNGFTGYFHGYQGEGVAAIETEAG